MPKFVPVIYENEDGSQIFRNDLIDIEFDVEGVTLVKRFDLGEAAAPPIPFPVAGSFIYNQKKRLFTIDSVGAGWVENNHGSLMSISSNMLLMVLMHSDSPHFDNALKFVKKEKVNYERSE